MKLIYKTSMVDRINEEIYEAKFFGKEIDRIILTPDEWYKLKRELLLCSHTATYSIDDNSLGGAVAKFKDIRIFVQ